MVKIMDVGDVFLVADMVPSVGRPGNSEGSGRRWQWWTCSGRTDLATLKREKVRE